MPCPSCLFISVSELDLLPFSITFLLSFWEVQYGIVGGVLVSGFMLLYQMARPDLKVELKSVHINIFISD